MRWLGRRLRTCPRMMASVMQIFPVLVCVSRDAMAMNVGVRPRWHGVVEVIVMPIVVRVHMLVLEGVVHVPVVVPFATMKP